MIESTVLAVIPVFGRDDALVTVPRLLAWHPKLQIIVVDNGNAPDRAAKLAALSGERVEVVRLNENRGGSGGYIAGMKRALEHTNCELVWLLDDDAEPNEETLPGLIRTFQELMAHGELVACVGSAVVRQDDPDFIVECGALYLTSSGRTGLTRVLNGESLANHPQEVLPVEYCAACSCLVPRAAFERVGLWEDVFIHNDDVEWCLRAEHKFGLKNFATTRSIVKHPDKSVEFSHNAWIQYYDMYNRLWLDRMYAPRAYAKEYFIGRMYELWARLFFLNHGKYYACRLVMADFRAGKRRLRPEVVSLFASHKAVGNMHLLSLPKWYVYLRRLGMRMSQGVSRNDGRHK